MAASSSSVVLQLLRQSSISSQQFPRRFFACADCLTKSKAVRSGKTIRTVSSSASKAASRHEYKSIRQTPFLAAFKSASQRRARSLATEALFPETASKAAQNAVSAAQKQPFFPATSRRVVGWWLFGSAASVFGIVVFGGLTRLTESGLSITEWRPVTGSLPPMSSSVWEGEYNKYRASPEFQLLNPNMTLDEFQKIYWMEYTHRLWGRVIGLSFLLPSMYFIARRQVSGPLARNLLLINGLIGLQGFVGWWMVKSGLKDDLFAKGSHPRVSQYRLATHLGLAFTVYVGMLWNGVQVFREQQLAVWTQPQQAKRFLDRLSSRVLRPTRVATMLLAGLVSLTAFSGALVAGLDAGLIYNEFPYMGLGLAPPTSELWDPFYSRRDGHADLWWRNMLENPSLVQLDHRILATTTFCAVHALFVYARWLRPAVRTRLPRGAKTALSAALHLVWVQVALGITTLLYLVPVPLAAAHQAGSLALLTSVVLLGSRVWTPPRLRRLVDQRYAVWLARRAVTARPASKRASATAALPNVKSVKPQTPSSGIVTST